MVTLLLLRSLRLCGKINNLINHRDAEDTERKEGMQASYLDRGSTAHLNLGIVARSQTLAGNAYPRDSASPFTCEIQPPLQSNRQYCD